MVKKTSKPKVAAANGVEPAANTVAKTKAAKAAKSTKARLTGTKTAAKKAAKAPRKQVKAAAIPARAEKAAAAKKADETEKVAQILDSKVVYEGPLFRVLHDHLIEPDGTDSERDVIRHNGSVVILAVNPGKHRKNPWIVIERQYRHAAGQYLWELPAGKLDAGEKPIDGAKRELSEETGYQAKKWSPLVDYFASPGFLGESMKVFLAEDLVAGDAHPEEDEHIDFRLVKLSELLEMVDKGKIVDGKTLTSILLYARQLGLKRKK